jgi:hypothetical protein
MEGAPKDLRKRVQDIMDEYDRKRNFREHQDAALKRQIKELESQREDQTKLIKLALIESNRKKDQARKKEREAKTLLEVESYSRLSTPDVGQIR